MGRGERLRHGRFFQLSIAGKCATARFEVELHDCEIQGEIPKSLNGAFYRLQRNGRADYKGRFVQTLRYRKQVEAGRQLYG
jgi:carotenoid cleavage dioxygenase